MLTHSGAPPKRSYVAAFRAHNARAIRLHLAEARCESPISDHSEQRSAHSAVSRRTTELEAVLPTVKSGWRQSRLRLSRAAFRAVTRARALRLHLDKPGAESHRPRSLWTGAPRRQPLGDRRISEPEGFPPRRRSLRLVGDVETAHPDLSERRSTLRCLSTVQRTESLKLDLSRQCSTPRLLSKAWCRVDRSALAERRSASDASRRSTP
jgi:hypothetical protein